MPYGLLGTPGNLDLRKRTGVSGLNVNYIDITGLVGDVDAGVTYDAVSHDILLTSRV